VFNLRTLTIRTVEIPLKYPFKTSKLNETDRQTIILELSDGKTSGFGEAPGVSIPIFSEEYNESAVLTIKKFFSNPLLNATSIKEFNDETNWIKGNNFARHGCEAVLYDYLAKCENIPLSKMLKASKTTVECQVSLGITSYEKLKLNIAEAAKTGFKRIKIKIDQKNNIEMLKKIKKEFPKLELTADANCAFSERDLPLLEKIDELELKMLEQPFGAYDLLLHSKLQKRIETPICLDESIPNPAVARDAIEMEACRIINVKPARVGGITRSLEIAELSTKNGIKCWIGGLLETSVGRSLNIAIAATNNFTLPNDINPPLRYLTQDIAEGLEFEKNMAKVPATTGIGIKINSALLEKYTVDKLVIK